MQFSNDLQISSAPPFADQQRKLAEHAAAARSPACGLLWLQEQPGRRRNPAPSPAGRPCRPALVPPHVPPANGSCPPAAALPQPGLPACPQGMPALVGRQASCYTPGYPGSAGQKNQPLAAARPPHIGPALPRRGIAALGAPPRPCCRCIALVAHLCSTQRLLHWPAAAQAALAGCRTGRSLNSSEVGGVRPTVGRRARRQSRQQRRKRPRNDGNLLGMVGKQGGGHEPARSCCSQTCQGQLGWDPASAACNPLQCRRNPQHPPAGTSAAPAAAVAPRGVIPGSTAPCT